MISCILLTAGESLRFGSPKALAQISSTKTIEFLQQKLIQSLVEEIIIVTGAHEALIAPYVFNHSKVRLVYNKDYKMGQTSSFQTALRSVDKNSHGFMLLPVDYPFVLTKTMDDLVNAFQQQNPDILIPAYQGKHGHPPIFHQSLKKDLLDFSANKGLDSFIRQRQVHILEVHDSGIIQTFNTPEELKDLLKHNHFGAVGGADVSVTE
ncbi:MAG: nucleotidyltransferase family protein [Candidatus Omnitrophica bacterium]|nr:nucleotidyltransferase family protein [Candidatus Omnitrophota bacterium]